MPDHPRPRRFRFDDIQPTVHWARIQHAGPRPGRYRTIRDFELIYIYEGAVNVHFANGGEPLPIGAGDLLLLPSAIRHRIEVPPEPDTVLLGIHFDFFREFPLLAEQDLIIAETERDSAQYGSMPAAEDGGPAFRLHYPGIPIEVREWMEQLIAEHARGAPDSGLACRGLMLLILSMLLRLHGRLNRSPLHAEYREAMQQLAAEMEARPGDAWANAAAAARFHISEDHFIRLFKDMIGMSPHKYVQRLRHREAKRLLRETDMKIELIGRRLGYDELHLFSKAFKKWQGIPPSSYRRLSLLR